MTYTARNLPLHQTHSEMGNMVLRKIERIYGLKQKDWQPCAAEQSLVEQRIDEFFESDPWKNTLIMQTGLARATSEQVEALERIAKEALPRYIDALYMREKIVRHPDLPRYTAATGQRNVQSVYDWGFARLNLANAYISHISNSVQSQFAPLLLNDQSNLKLHGVVVEAALHIHKEMDPLSHGLIEPVIKHKKQLPEQWVKDIENVWRVQRDELSKYYKLTPKPDKSR